MEREIERFRAADDEGTAYEVVVIQEYVGGHPRSGTGAIPGMQRLELDDGSTVTPVDKNTFVIVQTGKTIRKIA